jgi:TolA-binding protein
MSRNSNLDAETLLRELLDIGSCNLFFKSRLSELLSQADYLSFHAEFHKKEYQKTTHANRESPVLAEDRKRCARFVAFGVLSLLVAKEQNAETNDSAQIRQMEREISELEGRLRRYEAQDYEKAQSIRVLERDNDKLNNNYKRALKTIEVLHQNVQRLESIKEYIAPDNNRQSSEPVKSLAPKAANSATSIRVAREPSLEELKIASSFIEWCKQPGAMISKVAHFARDLKKAMAGMQVHAVHRDMDSPALPIEFHEQSVLSPAEYWLVTSGSSAWILPQPLNARHFRELDPCFVGDCAPATLRSISPAVVRRSGSVYVLDQEGEVS